MGALEPWHLVIILFVVMLLFGAKRLPELARSLGSSARELKNGLQEGADESAAASQPQATIAQSSAGEQPPTAQG